MLTKVQKWGNSLAVRIPKAFAAQAELTEDGEVEILMEGNRIILAPAQKEWKLAELIAKITPANTHHEVTWGDSSGREIW